MMSAEELEAVDDWRFRRRLATRSDAIRRLVRNGLWIEEDIGAIADLAEDAYDAVYQRYKELGDYLSQWEDPDAPPPEITPVEALERTRS